MALSNPFVEMQEALKEFVQLYREKLDDPRVLGGESWPEARILAVDVGSERFGFFRFLTELQKLLTPRGREITALVAKGLSNKEIAHHIRRSEATVAAHLRRVFDRLQVKSRMDLARLALLMGLGPQQ